MPFSSLDTKKIYYYVVCVIAFFVLMWGIVDFTSTSIGLYIIKSPSPALSAPVEEGAPATEKSEQFFDAYYQRKMLYDRLWDSLARVIVSGIIFVYFRYNANKLEKRA